MQPDMPFYKVWFYKIGDPRENMQSRAISLRSFKQSERKYVYSGIAGKDIHILQRGSYKRESGRESAFDNLDLGATHYRAMSMCVW